MSSGAYAPDHAPGDRGHAAAKRPALTGAASRSYNVASAWEKSASLSDEQLRAVALLSEACSHRPLPPHLAAESAAAAPDGTSAPSAATASGSAAGASAGTLLEDAILHNATEFHRWHGELEAACASEAEEGYAAYARLLQGHLSACGGVQARLSSTLDFLDGLVSLHQEVAARTAALSGGCAALLQDKAALVELSEALRARLRFFDEYEAAAAAFAAACAAPDAAGGAALLPLLRRLDECIAYVGSNPQYADAIAYATKFKQLQGRALGLVKGRVQAALRAAAQQVNAAVAEAAVSGAAAAAAASGGGSGTTSSAGLGRSGSSSSSSLMKQGSLGARGGPAPLLPEGAEVSLLYVRFRAAAEPSLRGLFAELDVRARAHPEYGRLLKECRGLYCGARQQLVAPFLSARLGTLAGAPLPRLLRSGAEALLRVAHLEAQLAEQLFGAPHAPPAAAAVASPPSGPASAGAPQAQERAPGGASAAFGAEALRLLVEPLGGLLYDVLRPRFVQLSDLEGLCELIDILQTEVLDEHAAPQQSSTGGGASTAATAAAVLRPVLQRTLADLQERLIYRAQAFIKDEIEGFTPGAADLDYPGRLECAAAAAVEREQRRECHTPAAAAGGADANGAAGQEEGAVAGAGAAPSDGHLPQQQQQQQQSPSAADRAGPQDGEEERLLEPSDQWFAPVRSALLLLSQLYRCIDGRTFSGLAHEAVAAATGAVQGAARGVAKQAGPLDAQLFAISHLLFLREQIAPFDVDFAVQDIDLDFSHMRDHMRRILAGELSLFALSSSNAVVQMMMGRGGPRVVTAHADSKRDLEAQLRDVCEGYIMSLTKLVVDPLLNFISKVTAIRLRAAGRGAAAVAGAEEGANKDAADAALARPLREQAFAGPTKLAELVTRVNAALAQQLPAAAARTRLYLPNPATRAILFRPVKSNIAEAHGQVAQLLDAEYTPEEAAGVPLMQPDALGAALDVLS